MLKWSINECIFPSYVSYCVIIEPNTKAQYTECTQICFPCDKWPQISFFSWRFKILLRFFVFCIHPEIPMCAVIAYAWLKHWLIKYRFVQSFSHIHDDFSCEYSRSFLWIQSIHKIQNSMKSIQSKPKNFRWVPCLRFLNYPWNGWRSLVPVGLGYVLVINKMNLDVLGFSCSRVGSAANL